VPKAGFESAFSPCKQRDVASNYGFPGRYDADRASLIGKVFPSGTAPEPQLTESREICQRPTHSTRHPYPSMSVIAR
jgi:hypothetical protein